MGMEPEEKAWLKQAEIDAGLYDDGKTPEYRYYIYEDGRIDRMPNNQRINITQYDERKNEWYNVYERKGGRSVWGAEVVEIVRNQIAEHLAKRGEKFDEQKSDGKRSTRRPTMDKGAA